MRTGVLKDTAEAPRIASFDTFLGIISEDPFRPLPIKIRADAFVQRLFSPHIDSGYNRFNGILNHGELATKKGRRFRIINTDPYPEIDPATRLPETVAFNVMDITGKDPVYAGFILARNHGKDMHLEMAGNHAQDMDAIAVFETFAYETFSHQALRLPDEMMGLVLDTDPDHDPFD